MRILNTYTDNFTPGTYAVIVNPIAGGLAGQPALRYRLIRSSDPQWKQKVNTLMSVSKTPGVVICQTIDVIAAWNDLPSTKRQLNKLVHEARLLSGDLHKEQSTKRISQ